MRSGWVAAVVLAHLAAAAPVLAGGGTERVSVATDGTQGDGPSSFPAISADGRFVVFHSLATNLVPDDTNGFPDVFIHDRQARATARVSVGPGRRQGDGGSVYPAVSAGGRFVAFRSSATNLVEGDTNNAEDIFVHDRRTGATERVSVGPGGAQANGDNCNMSEDGCFWGPAISADGRFVAFTSVASNLVVGDTNGEPDVFVRDRLARKTTRVSIGPGGHEGNAGSADPSISPGGRFVAFASRAGNLVPGDGDGTPDLFVHNRRTRTTTRVAVGPSSAPSVSVGARFVAFGLSTPNLDVFVHDRQKHVTERVSVGLGDQPSNGFSGPPMISPGGRFVTFHSYASNLVAGDTNGVIDVFVHDRWTRRTTRVSVGPEGRQGDADSLSPSISLGGRSVAFFSEATNLVEGDTNGVGDIFVHDRRASLPPGRR